MTALKAACNLCKAGKVKTMAKWSPRSLEVFYKDTCTESLDLGNQSRT